MRRPIVRFLTGFLSAMAMDSTAVAQPQPKLPLQPRQLSGMSLAEQKNIIQCFNGILSGYAAHNKTNNPSYKVRKGIARKAEDSCTAEGLSLGFSKPMLKQKIYPGMEIPKRHGGNDCVYTRFGFGAIC